MPSLTEAAFLLPVLFVFARLGGLKFLLGDADTGYHIRAGEWMLDHRQVLDHDIFSYTKAGEPWYAWEWLWDVAFAWLHRVGGMEAVVGASLLVISVTLALLYRLARRQSGNALLAIAVTFVAAGASSIHWLARPHLVTLLLAVIFYGLLERAREGRTRLLAWLPLLAVVWTNLHGGFFVGTLLVLAYAAGEAVGWLLEPEPEERRGAARRLRAFAVTAAGCIAASLVNPFGLKLHVHIFGYLTDNYAFNHIQEFLSLSFHQPAARFMEALIVLGVAAGAWSVYRRRYAHAVLIAGWLHLALLSGRNVPIYALVTAPPAAWALSEWLEKLPRAQVAEWARKAARSFQEFAAEMGAVDLRARVPALSLAVSAALLTLLGAFGGPPKLRVEYPAESYPVKALATLQRPECVGRVFTPDEWGDYLIYRLYPATKVFVDGRSDFYGSQFNQQYLDVMDGKHGWEKTLEQHGVRTVLLPVGASLASTLKESARWQVAHDDGVAIVFRRAAPPTQWARASCAEAKQVSAAVGSGVISDRLIAQPSHRDRTVTKSTLRREPS